MVHPKAPKPVYVPPTEEEIRVLLGEPLYAAWSALRSFTEATYQVQPLPWSRMPTRGTWHLCYKRGGRPLVELIPHPGCFQAMVVLGKVELDAALERLADFGPTVQSYLTNTPRLHDGCWMYIRIEDPLSCLQDEKDVEQLVLIKRKPVKVKAAGAA